MHAAQLTNGHAATALGPFAQRDDLDARLNWLVAFDAAAERRARLFRTPREEREMLLMRRPVGVEHAFAFFGLLLGTLPPAAIFLRLFSLFDADGKELGLLFVPMLAICATFGREVGRRVGRTIGDYERAGWARMLLFTAAAAFGWAVITGAAGGVPYFVVGAFVGIFCALLVALPCFLVFTTFHRLLARGGMIDARHLRPLAWGVTATAAALVLGL